MQDCILHCFFNFLIICDKGDSVNNVLFELRGITKLFGNVVANKNIDFSVREGEIHALLGENGSGKTTLMNILSGIYTPDSGTIIINGEEVTIKSPEDAIKLGIGMIHQHFKLVDVFSAKENIIMGQSGSIRQNQKNLTREIEELSNRFGLNINLDKKIYQMSVSEKQTVEIMKVLFRKSKILILDEPTAVLTPQEIDKLFEILRELRDDGCAIVIITHKLNEVMEISDRVTILRKGESVATVETKQTNAKELTELMVGHSVDLSIERPVVEDKTKDVLQVDNLTIFDEDGVKVIDGMSFALDGGEILGVAGVAGSGQKELCEAIAGLHPVAEGSIEFKGRNIVGLNPNEIINLGVIMSFIPEDRLGMGLVANMDMVDNVILKDYKRQKGLLLSRKPARKTALKMVEDLDIVTQGVQYPIRLLSGGNVQKVLLGREINSSPQLLITAYPVRGLDINSSYVIYDMLNEQKKKGVAVLYIGEDLNVLLELCDRIMVICGGRIMGMVEPKDVTIEDLGLMMTGHTYSQILAERGTGK
jgi:ABC-type uncharacterized transport system ATPase subunit